MAIPDPIAIQLPRHMSAINLLAARCGFLVATREGEFQGNRRFFADWTGPKARLADLGLFKPGQLRRLPFSSGRLHAGSCYDTGWWLPLVTGFISMHGDDVHYEVDFGDVPSSVTISAGVELAAYDEFFTYHGQASALVEAGICEPKCLSTTAQAFRSGNGSSEHAKAWTSRRQPDGTYLFRIETDAAFRKRAAWHKRTREETAAYVARFCGESPPKPDPRPPFIRLIVDNTR